MSITSPTSLKIRECNDPLVDIRTSAGLLFGPPPECPETEPEYCLVRREVYLRLLRVQQSLPRCYRLRVYEGLRNLGVQALLFEQEKQRVRMRCPRLTEKQVHAEASILVSPVVNWDGSANVPSHSTGGAVDIEIVDASGKVIDFGMEIREWSSVPPELCAPNPVSLTEVAARNRRILASSMEQGGFVNYQHEWWHFSYGDQYWAARHNHAHAIYGPCSAEMISAASRAAPEMGKA
jgi:D-alanyl-D-alanine dipeptidase